MHENLCVPLLLDLFCSADSNPVMKIRNYEFVRTPSSHSKPGLDLAQSSAHRARGCPCRNQEIQSHSKTDFLPFLPWWTEDRIEGQALVDMSYAGLELNCERK